MEDIKGKIIGIIIVTVSFATVLTVSVLAYNSFKKTDIKESQASTNTTNTKTIGASSSKSSGGNSELSSLDISSSSKGKSQMEGYDIIGKIKIPKVDLECNILGEVTKRSIEIAVAQMYTTDGLNKPGNTVIYGHNYRNTLFFSRNDELSVGDTIIITDYDQNETKEYEIYDIFETTSTDTSFYTRTSEITGGKAEVTLSTCTDDASDTDRRLIVMAQEK